MKKFVALLLALAMVFVLGCTPSKPSETEPAQPEKVVKAGLICLHDENSTYDLNFINAFKAACEAEGVEYIIKTGVDESNACYEAAADLVDQGCNFVFADSFGHESYMLIAAQEFTDVQFCHATGTRAHTEKLANYHNAFASIYEGRYLAGVAAGLKLNEIGGTKMGYIGAFTYAEVISGYTSYYLGAKSVCPDVTMEVIFTGSWYDEAKEKEAAEKLISDGCVLISQHADSMGAPTACENAGVPNVSYNGSTISACPNTFIVSSRINWEPYFHYAFDAMRKGEEIATDYVGTINTESVQLTAVNEKAAAKGTVEKLEEVKAKLVKGELHVFDIETFTVQGEKMLSYKADVDSDDAYTPDTEVIVDGYFNESVYRSAPYFDLQIDGIHLQNSAF